jgi:hypothetical protein
MGAILRWIPALEDLDLDSGGAMEVQRQAATTKHPQMRVDPHTQRLGVDQAWV